jgi:hypothetical protein
MQIIAVKPHQVFLHNGEKHSLDLEGNSGSGKVAVKNIETGERYGLHYATKVALLDSGDFKELNEDLETVLEDVGTVLNEDNTWTWNEELTDTDGVYGPPDYMLDPEDPDT